MNLRDKHIQFGAHVVGALALALLALTIFSWLAFEVREGETLRLDGAIRGAVHQQATPALTSAMKAFTVLGASVSVFVLLTSAVVAFWAAGLRRHAMMMVIAMAGSLILELTLKHVFHRARPEPFFHLPLPHSYSFPSGHALAAACFYGMLALLVTSRVKHRAIRIAVWIVCVAMIVLIGLSRIYLGVHYPSDVIAGYMAACVWLVALSAARDRLISSTRAEATQAKLRS